VAFIADNLAARTDAFAGTTVPATRYRLPAHLTTLLVSIGKKQQPKPGEITPREKEITINLI